MNFRTYGLFELFSGLFGLRDFSSNFFFVKKQILHLYRPIYIYITLIQASVRVRL